MAGLAEIRNTHATGDQGAAQSFDLLCRGLEITTSGQVLSVLRLRF